MSIGFLWGWPSLLRSRGDGASHVWQAVLVFNRFYLMSVLRPLPARLERFGMFGPCGAGILTFGLFFNGCGAVRGGWVGLCFF